MNPSLPTPRPKAEPRRMVAIRASAFATATAAAADLGVPVVDLVSHAVREYAASVRRTTAPGTAPRSAAVLTVAQAKAKAGRGAK